MDLCVFSSWRFSVFWLCGSAEHSSVCLALQAPGMTLSTVRISWIDPCVSCQCIVGDVLCCVYRRRRGFQSWFGFEHFYSSSAKAGWDESPRPPVIGQRILSGNALLRTFVTYRLTFIAQHALLDFLGQDQVARLRSGPLEDYNSPCVPRWAWRGEQHKRALCYHRVNKIELNCARCFWKLPRVNTCAALIVWRCETHKLHSELQNNLKDIAKEKSCC